MPIDTGSMMLRLNPMSPIDLGSGGRLSMERERLRQAREEFAALQAYRKQQLEQNEWAERGEMARAQLVSERLAREAEAAKAAKLQEQKLTAAQKFGELNTAGNIQGAAGMVPIMEWLGIGVDKLGTTAGMPSYRIDMDPEKTAREASQSWERGAHPIDDFEGNESASQSLGRVNELGYPADDSGLMNEPAGISSTEEAFSSARDALAASEAAPRLEDGSLAPTRGPDEEDFTGGVPKNVLDMGAIQAQTLQSLDPALAGLINAYPAGPNNEYRESMAETANAVRGLGLPAAEAVKLVDQIRGGGPDALIKAQIEAGEKSTRLDEDREFKKEIQRQKFINVGRQRADQIFTRQNIGATAKTYKAAEMVKQALANDDPVDDGSVGHFMAELMGEVGPKSNEDIRSALGLSTMSTVDQVIEFITTRIIGGHDSTLKNSLLGVIERSQKLDEEKMFNFLDKIEKGAKGESNEAVREGWLQYRDVVPSVYLEKYDGLKKPNPDDSVPAGTGTPAAAPAGGKKAALTKEELKKLTPEQRRAAAADISTEVGGETMGTAPLPATLDGVPPPETPEEKRIRELMERRRR